MYKLRISVCFFISLYPCTQWIYIYTEVCIEEWIEIGTENVNEGGNLGNDKFRFLDFQSEVYAEYPVKEILEYKFEYEYNAKTGEYGKEIIFKINDPEFEFLKDTTDSVNLNIPITVSSSTETNIPAGNRLFCKACSSQSAVKYGDTCWAFLNGDTNRACGCNSGGWIGSGVYYGGWTSGKCNKCGCQGGGYSGWKTNRQQKGKLPSIGLRISIKVCGSGGMYKYMFIIIYHILALKLLLFLFV